MEPWRTLQTDIIINNRWCRVHKDTVELPSGAVIDDYFVHVRPDVVLVLPIMDNGNVIMVKQYKHGAKEILLEFPGGFYDPEDGTAEEAAARELREETGYTCNVLEPLTAVYDNPTKDTNKIFFFLARNVHKSHDTEFDATENIETMEIPFDDIPRLIREQKLKVTGSIAIYYMAKMAMENI